MKIDVIAFDEEQNIISLDIDDEAKQLLLEIGFNKLLTDALEKLCDEHKHGHGQPSAPL